MDICLCLFNKTQYALSVSVRNSQFDSVFVHCSWTCQIWYRWKLMKYRFILICVSIIKYFFFRCNLKRNECLFCRVEMNTCALNISTIYISFANYIFNQAMVSQYDDWRMLELICVDLPISKMTRKISFYLFV